MSAVDELLDLFAHGGHEEYGEAVTIEDHMFLTAQAALQAGLRDELVVAGLLHDVGHLIDDPDDAFGVHDHGPPGAAWVEPRFGPVVAAAVGMHVEAKRWLCAVEPGYHDELSPASQHTLQHQGGPMSDAERTTFETRPGWDDAVALRRLEDSLGKTPAPTIDRDALLALARRLEVV